MFSRGATAHWVLLIMLSASSGSNDSVIARTQRSFTYLSGGVIDRGLWFGSLPGYSPVFKDGVNDSIHLWEAALLFQLLLINLILDVRHSQ